MADLRELGSGLLSFYGQHEHRRLMLGGVQLEILDAFCGPEQERLTSLLGANASFHGPLRCEAE